MKDFIIKQYMKSPLNGIEPFYSTKNAHGVDVSFYLINKNNFKKYKNSVKDSYVKIHNHIICDNSDVQQKRNKEFQNQIEDLIHHGILLDAVAIIDKPFRFNKFMQKNDFEKINSNITVSPITGEKI